MNVLHVSPSYFPATYWGGPIWSVHHLNSALATLGDIRLEVLTTDSAGPSIDSRIDVVQPIGTYPSHNVNICRRIAGLSISPRLLVNLPGLVKWADVVHLTGAYSFPTIPTLLCCRCLNKPIVWSPRGGFHQDNRWSKGANQRLKRIWEFVCNSLISHASTVIHTTSEQEFSATHGRFPRAKLVVISNGVILPSQSRSGAWCPSGTLRLVFVGRLAPVKGIENLLLALHMICDPTITLTVYGSGDRAYEDRLRALASDLQLLDKTVHFAGHLDDSEKRTAFEHSDVCVVPSHSESFSMVIAEALAHGLPVIASRGTPWSAIEEVGCGIWIDNSPESLAAAIRRIRTMPLQELGNRGRAWMARQFSWQQVATTMRQTYFSLLTKSHGQ